MVVTVIACEMDSTWHAESTETLNAVGWTHARHRKLKAGGMPCAREWPSRISLQFPSPHIQHSSPNLRVAVPSSVTGLATCDKRLAVQGCIGFADIMLGQRTSDVRSDEVENKEQRDHKAAKAFNARYTEFT